MGSMIGQSSLVWALAAVAGVLLVWLSGALRYIPNNRVGIVEKRWSARGSVHSGFIALSGEAGFQPRGAARRLALPAAASVPRPHACRW